jgi:hypothetical protein
LVFVPYLGVRPPPRSSFFFLVAPHITSCVLWSSRALSFHAITLITARTYRSPLLSGYYYYYYYMLKFNWASLADSKADNDGMNELLTGLFRKVLSGVKEAPVSEITCVDWHWGNAAPELQVLSMTAISEDVRRVLTEKHGLAVLSGGAEADAHAGIMVRVALDFESNISFTLKTAVGIDIVNLPVQFRCKRLHLAGTALAVLHDEHVFIGFERESKEASSDKNTVDSGSGPFRDLHIEADLGDVSRGAQGVLTDLDNVGAFLVERLQEGVKAKLVHTQCVCAYVYVSFIYAMCVSMNVFTCRCCPISWRCRSPSSVDETDSCVGGSAVDGACVDRERNRFRFICR